MKNSILSNHKKTLFVGLALVLLIISFINKDTIAGFFNKENSETRLAKVASLSNEVRKKKTASLNWKTASINDPINRGDSISTGKQSSAKVMFDNGQSLSLEQNTLIVFDKTSDTPEFVTGNIKLSVNGNMKIKIGAEVINVAGKNADIQVFKEGKKNKQKLVLLKGESKVSSKKHTIQLQANKVVEAKQVELKPAEFKKFAAKEKLQEVIEESKVAVDSTAAAAAVEQAKAAVAATEAAAAVEEATAAPVVTDLATDTTVFTEEITSPAIASAMLGTANSAAVTSTSPTQPDAGQITANQPAVVTPAPAVPTVVAPPAPPKIYNYTLYDFYKRNTPTGSDFTLNKSFPEKPNGVFEAFSPASFELRKQVELTGTQPLKLQFNIVDSVKPIGYVVELSQNTNFSEDATRYFWARSRFEYPFETAGTYFLRYRKVLSPQNLTAYSPLEQFTILPKKIEVKLAEVKKVIIKQPVKIIPAPAPKEQVVVKKAEPIIKLEPIIERKPTAIQEAQSTVKLTPESTFKNIKFTDSYVDAHLTQGYLVSNRQFEAGNPYSQNVNLGFDITHWSYNHGFKAEVSKSVISTASANSILLAEIDYLYRILVNSSFLDSNKMQFHTVLGFEFYQNSNNTSSEFLSSYNLFKVGLGASVPLFSFWNAEINLLYGMGSANQAKSMQLNTRISYYLRPNLSVGLGFKARKYDFVLLDKPQLESLAETYTTVRYHY